MPGTALGTGDGTGRVPSGNWQDACPHGALRHVSDLGILYFLARKHLLC